MLGASELLMEGDPREDQEPLIHALGSSAKHLLRLLDDVLDLSRMQSGRLDLVIEPVKLRPLVDELQRVHAVSAEAKGIELACTVDDGVPEWVCTDATRLRQVLHNLLSNAVKFTERGGVKWSMVRSATGRLRCEVQDSGPGIASEYQDRVFAPYDRGETQTARSNAGTGLGLSIARRIAEAMGGELTLRSEAGVGSVFTFELRAAEHRPGQAVDELAGARLDGARVLLVEDNPVSALVSKRMLEGAGALVIHATTGAAAIESTLCHSLDLCLMDLGLPDMSGIDAIEAIRALAGPRAQVPIYSFSASLSEDRRLAAEAAGATGFLSKPMRLEELRQAVAAGIATA